MAPAGPCTTGATEMGRSALFVELTFRGLLGRRLAPGGATVGLSAGRATRPALGLGPRPCRSGGARGLVASLLDLSRGCFGHAGGLSPSRSGCSGGLLAALRHLARGCSRRPPAGPAGCPDRPARRVGSAGPVDPIG